MFLCCLSLLWVVVKSLYRVSVSHDQTFYVEMARLFLNQRWWLLKWILQCGSVYVIEQYCLWNYNFWFGSYPKTISLVRNTSWGKKISKGFLFGLFFLFFLIFKLKIFLKFYLLVFSINRKQVDLQQDLYQSSADGYIEFYQLYGISCFGQFSNFSWYNTSNSIMRLPIPLRYAAVLWLFLKPTHFLF